MRGCGMGDPGRCGFCSEPAAPLNFLGSGSPSRAPALSAAVGEVTGWRGSQLRAQVSAKAGPPHRFGGEDAHLPGWL